MSSPRSSLFVRAARKGMTLVEIMVVIAIIGMLTSVVAVGVVGYWDDANVSTTKLQMGRMSEALTTYAASHKQKYPTTSDGLGAAKKYFPNQEIPVDAWGNPFQYYSPGTHGAHDYEIISLGKDGKEGGTDADADLRSWEK